MASNMAYQTVEEIKSDLRVVNTDIDTLMSSVNEDKVLEGEVLKNLSDINKRIKLTKKANLKNSFIRNLKITGKIARYLCPYVIYMGLCFGLPTLLGSPPFYREEHYQYKSYAVTIDNHGGKEVESEYDSWSNSDYNFLRIEVSTPWEQKVDGKYYRTIKEGKIYNDYDTLELEEMINNPDFDVNKLKHDYYYLNDTEKIKTSFETKEELTSEELEDAGYVKIRYCYKDLDDVLLMPQSVVSDIITSGLFSLVFIGLCLLTLHSQRKNFSTEDFLFYIEGLKDRYNKVDTKLLRALYNEGKLYLEIKKKDIKTI